MPRLLERECKYSYQSYDIILCKSCGLVLGGLLGHRETVGVGVVGDDREDAARVREPLRELQRVGPLLRVRQLHRREVAVRPALFGHLHQRPLREPEFAHCAHIYRLKVDKCFWAVPSDNPDCLLFDSMTQTSQIAEVKFDKAKIHLTKNVVHSVSNYHVNRKSIFIMEFELNIKPLRLSL